MDSNQYVYNPNQPQEFIPDEEEDPELARAIRESIEEARKQSQEGEDYFPDMEEAIRLSILESRNNQEAPPPPSPQNGGLSVTQEQISEAEEIRAIISDPEQLRDILKTLPGVNPNDPRFKDFTNKVPVTNITEHRSTPYNFVPPKNK